MLNLKDLGETINKEVIINHEGYCPPYELSLLDHLKCLINRQYKDDEIERIFKEADVEYVE